MQYRILLTTILLVVSSFSFAHSVYIFAWIDGAQICTESYFTKKNKVRSGEVLMQNTAGDTLAKGITREDGTYCFPLPTTAQNLNFVVLAGAGHRGQFTLEENELTTAINENNNSAPQPIQNITKPLKVEHVTASEVTEPPDLNNKPSLSVNMTETQLRSLISTELQKQLSPLRQSIAERFEDNTPGFKEIFGGIGWLLGLGAIGYWYSQRRTKG